MKALMNKAICLILLASGASALLAQGPSNCGNDRENLTVGSDFSGRFGFLPFEALNDQVDPNVLTGFDVDVACEVAHRLGFNTVTFRQTPFNLLLIELNEGETIDIALSARSITEARNNGDLANFVKYNDDDLGIVLDKEFADGDAALRDPETVLERLNEIGTTIAAVQGTRQMQILMGDDYPRIIVLPVANISAGVDAILDQLNSATGLFTDGPTALLLAGNDPDTLFGEDNVAVAEGSDVPSVGLGIAINTECCQLYADIAQAIDDMNNDGTLAALREDFEVGSFDPVDLTPEDCANTESNINSNAIYNWLFSRFCPCSPEIVLPIG